ncbi:MAG: DUF423 domain-containing protein [Bacteroidota bacterium]
MTIQKRLLVISAFSAAIAVALGAMGAHFLKSKLETGLITETNLQTFDTAVKYQMYHSLAILFAALFFEKIKDKLISAAAYSFMAGIVLFSGSLYFLSTAGLLGLGNVKWLGPITPLGGLFFIAGWMLLGFSGFRNKTT